MEQCCILKMLIFKFQNHRSLITNVSSVLYFCSTGGFIFLLLLWSLHDCSVSKLALFSQFTIQAYDHLLAIFYLNFWSLRSLSQLFEEDQAQVFLLKQQSVMSIYSGFATRLQEQCYDECVDSLLFILQKRIIKFYKNQEADEEKFITLVLKIHNQLRSMENNKYLQPKTSNSINELIKFMQLHQKNFTNQKNKTYQQDRQSEPNYQYLPAVEHKAIVQENAQKKKESLWVEKKGLKNERMVDQQMQTMGIIYEKKNSQSPKLSTNSKGPINRQAVSSLKTKYKQKNSNGRHSNQQQLHPNFANRLKDRSQSNHLTKNDSLYEVKDHLQQMQLNQKKKRRSKLNTRLGLKELNTEQQNSEYDVGDIIKDYVTRIRKTHYKIDNFKRTDEFKNE